jgi:hypothetical protein
MFENGKPPSDRGISLEESVPFGSITLSREHNVYETYNQKVY